MSSEIPKEFNIMVRGSKSQMFGKIFRGEIEGCVEELKKQFKRASSEIGPVREMQILIGDVNA